MPQIFFDNISVHFGSPCWLLSHCADNAADEGDTYAADKTCDLKEEGAVIHWLSHRCAKDQSEHADSDEKV
jgi:hypothetical protein